MKRHETSESLKVTKVMNRLLQKSYDQFDTQRALFATRLRAFRTANDITQARVAKHMRVSVSTVSRLERGLATSHITSNLVRAYVNAYMESRSTSKQDPKDLSSNK